MTTPKCQRCGLESWLVSQADLNVGALKHWKVQLCCACTELIQRAIVEILIVQSPKPLPSSVSEAEQKA